MKERFYSWNNIIAFIVSLLIMGEVINDFLSFMVNSDSNLYRLILVAAFVLLYVFIYIRYFNIHKLIIKDIVILFIFGAIYVLFNFFFINAYRPLFVYFLIGIILMYIVYTKNVKWNNYFLIFMIFTMIVLINTIMKGYTTEYAGFKIQYFLVKTVVPCFFIMFLTNMENLKTAKLYIISYSIITLLFSLIGYITGIGMNEIGIFALLGGDKIVTSFALGSVFVVFFFQIKRSNKTYINVLLIISLFIIAFFIMIAGARGPVVSLALTMGVFVFKLRGIKYKTLMILGIVLLILFTYTDYFKLLSEENIGIARIENFIRREDPGMSDINEESSGRLDLYVKTISEFEQNAFMGKGIGKDELQGWYPHNSILEILSQTGILGFLPFAAMILIFLYHFLINSIARYDEYNIYKFLFIYTFLESLFSGSIFMNLTFWVLLIINGIVLTHSAKKSMRYAVEAEAD